MKNIIGVFGLICSGKSSFSKLLANSLDALYIDADKLGHEALENKKDIIVKEFSENVLDSNNNIDRKKLGSIVFSNSRKLKKLQDITYPYIEKRVEDLVKSTDKNVVIEAALIMRSNIYKLCNSLVFVNAKTSNILERMQKTRNISEHNARKILKMQRDVKNKKFNADIIVNNMRDYNHLVITSQKLGLYYGTKSKRKYGRKRLFY